MTPLRSISGIESIMRRVHATRGHARQFWRVFETSRVPMTIADTERQHLAANAAARLLFRLTRAEVLRTRIDDLCPEDQLPLMHDRWARLMSHGTVAGPYEVSLPDGSRVSIVYSALANALPGQHLIVFAPDDWPEDELDELAELGDDAPTPPTGRLTEREREVLRLIAAGAARQEIADELTISVATVRTHVRNILRKLSARNRPHAIAVAMQGGLLDVAPNGQPPA